MAPNPEQKVDTQPETQTSAPRTGVETTPGQTQLGQLLTEVTGNLTPEQEAKLKELYDKKRQKSAERDQLVVEANGYKTAETWVNNPESTIPGLDNLVVMPKIDQKVEDTFKLQEADLKQFGLSDTATATLKQFAKGIIYEHFTTNGRDDNSTSEYSENTMIPKLSKLFESIKKIYDGGGHPYKSAVDMLQAFSVYTGLNFFHDDNFDTNQLRQFVLLDQGSFDKLATGFAKYALVEKDISDLVQEVNAVKNGSKPAEVPVAATSNPEPLASTPASAPAEAPTSAPASALASNPPATPANAPAAAPSAGPSAAPTAQNQPAKSHTGIAFIDGFFDFMSSFGDSTKVATASSSSGGGFLETITNFFKGDTGSGAAEGGFLAGIFNMFKGLGSKPAETRTEVASSAPASSPSSSPASRPASAPTSAPAATPVGQRKGPEALPAADAAITARARKDLPPGSKGAKSVTPDQAIKARELLTQNSGTYGIVGTETTSDGRRIAYVRERHGADPSVGDSTHQHPHDGVSVIELPPSANA